MGAELKGSVKRQILSSTSLNNLLTNIEATMAMPGTKAYKYAKPMADAYKASKNADNAATLLDTMQYQVKLLEAVPSELKISVTNQFNALTQKTPLSRTNLVERIKNLSGVAEDQTRQIARNNLREFHSDLDADYEEVSKLGDKIKELEASSKNISADYQKEYLEKRAEVFKQDFDTREEMLAAFDDLAKERDDFTGKSNVSTLTDERNQVLAKSSKKLLRKLLADSPVTEKEATEFADSIEIKKSLFKTYPEEEIRSDIAEFYKITGGRLRKLEIKTTPTRAFAQLGKGSISLTKRSDKSVLWHEMGHLFETDAGVAAATKGFLARRTKGESPRRLRDIVPNTNYRRDEISRPDSFYNAYVGKLYGGNTTEVVSMAIQEFTDPVKMSQLYVDDREMFELMVGIMKGTPEHRSTERSNDAETAKKAQEFWGKIEAVSKPMEFAPYTQWQQPNSTKYFEWNEFVVYHYKRGRYILYTKIEEKRLKQIGSIEGKKADMERMTRQAFYLASLAKQLGKPDVIPRIHGFVNRQQIPDWMTEETELPPLSTFSAD